MRDINARLFHPARRILCPSSEPVLEHLEDRLLLSTSLFPAPEQFIISQADGATSVFAADLDGDGDMDVLSSSQYDDTIAWSENTDGQGTFGPQQVITTFADGAWSVFAADVDGDGDTDVLSASERDDKIAWYENTDGLGTFGPQRVISTLADRARSVFAADIDGDGDTDVLAAPYLGHQITWYENTDGLGTFGSEQTVTTLVNGPHSVFAADVDGDGDTDVLSASVVDDKVAWYENTDGLGTFGSQQIITTSANGAQCVFAADMDGDGDADVLSASYSDNEVAWYENTDGLGTFGPQQIITASAQWAHSVSAADVDGDGDMDVLSGSFNDDTVAWYENIDGLGTFGLQQVITASANGTNFVVAADLDGDGDADVLSASSNDDTVAWYRNTSAPTITSLSVTPQIDENSLATLIGSFNDPGTLDQHIVQIDWTDGSVETLVLSVGDRSFSATHQYTDDEPIGTPADDYIISVTISDHSGHDSQTATVTVNNVAPAADAGADQTVDEGTAVDFLGAFTDPGSVDTHSYLWDFGDGATATDLTASHTYIEDGVYVATLTITDDDGGVGSDTMAVTVNNAAPQIAAVNLDSVIIGENGVVTLSGNFTDAGIVDTHTVQIDWGDGQSSQATIDQIAGVFSASHQYLDDFPGGYGIQVTVTDDDASQDSVTTSVVVNNVAPAVVAGPDQTANEGDAVAFAGSFTDPGSQDTHSYLWDFGDGVTATDLTATHIYADDGVYTATLIVTDDDGGVGTDTMTVTVNGVTTTAPPVITALSITSQVDENGLATLSGSFTDPDAMDQHTLLIDWADGTTETLVLSIGNRSFSVTHQYLDDNPTGTPSDDYVVSATVSDNTGSDTATATVTVNNVAPTVKIEPVAQVVTIDTAPQTFFKCEEVNLRAVFADLGIADTWTASIDWGDGQTSDGTLDPENQTVTASHAYSTSGTYVVTVSVTDDDGGIGTATLEVTVMDTVTALRSMLRNIGKLDVPRCVKASLRAKLRPAIRLLQKRTASNQALKALLNSFMRTASRWHKKGKLTDQAHSQLIASAEYIKLDIMSRPEKSKRYYRTASKAKCPAKHAQQFFSKTLKKAKTSGSKGTQWMWCRT